MMANDLKLGERSRFTVEFPCAIEKKLRSMAEERGVTKADLIRAAVRLISEMDVLEAEGFSVGGWKDAGDGSRETVKFVVAV